MRVVLSHSQIYRFASRQDIKALIEQEQTRLSEVLHNTVENMLSLMEGMEMAEDKDER